MIDNNLRGLARTHNLAECLEQASPEQSPIPKCNPIAPRQDSVLMARQDVVGTVVIADVTGLAEFLASTLELRFNEAYVYNNNTYHNATWYAQIAVCKSCKWTADYKRPYISF